MLMPLLLPLLLLMLMPLLMPLLMLMLMPLLMLMPQATGGVGPCETSAAPG